ncbi:hypothetical protein GN244_ATG01251 [Phytophthora infestans]|uniref:Uncharacterized protein n=1 Tax=Phytophthora infestans TaxID=4787 RepID=A0A833T2H2_PHYIN|nr:hypothetical protein GN244_ATG01251 [Phytophthora infestans]
MIDKRSPYSRSATVEGEHKNNDARHLVVVLEPPWPTACWIVYWNDVELGESLQELLKRAPATHK